MEYFKEKLKCSGGNVSHCMLPQPFSSFGFSAYPFSRGIWHDIILHCIGTCLCTLYL